MFTKLRKFTNSDWLSYGGAENFDNGDDPIFGSFVVSVSDWKGGYTQQEAEVVFTKYGGHVIYFDQNDNEAEYDFSAANSTNVMFFITSNEQILASQLIKVCSL